MRLPSAFESFSAVWLLGAKPPKMDLADYVLSRFGAEEQKIMDEAFGEAAEAAVMMMTTGAERAMNHYNAKKKAE